jgi:hypothetical protein
MPTPLQFTNSDFEAIERLLSAERFSTYLGHSGGDRNRAFRLYIHNLRLSSSLFECIGGLEVALRNSVHIVLTRAFQSDAWYDRVPFLWQPHEMASLQKAKSQINSRKMLPAPSRVISETNFGFWCGILKKHYSAALWIPHLHKAFPYRRLGHADAQRRLDGIRILRNRIAHHECILHLDLGNEYTKILDTIDWICPIMRAWIETNNSFPEIWQSPPVRF